MALVVPNPTVPTNGQALDASPLLANLNAVYQAIQLFDGSQIQAGSIVAAAMNAAINPNTLLKETLAPFVQTGCIWSTVSGLNGTMTAGIMYINGIRVTVNSVASNAFAASKDTYIDIDVNGNITYQAVTTNTASPAITANSIRVGICIAGASITSWNQGGFTPTAPVINSSVLMVSDSIGNLIYPNDPVSRLLGYRQMTADFSTAASTDTQVTGLICPAIIPLNRKVKVSGFTYFAKNATSTQAITTRLWQTSVGGTQVSQGSFFAPANGYGQAALIEGEISPAAGLQSYFTSVASTAGGTATYSAIVGAPMFLKVELL